jgi:hypothetical protein
LPTINDHPSTTGLPESYTNIERLLAERKDVAIRSTIRLCTAQKTLKRANQNNARNQKPLHEFRRVLGFLRSR